MKICPECKKEVAKERKGKKCCSDECNNIRKKRMAKESSQAQNRAVREIYEKKPTGISHIDDIERYARAKGTTYAELQKQKTLSMAEPIKREI